MKRLETFFIVVLFALPLVVDDCRLSLIFFYENFFAGKLSELHQLMEYFAPTFNVCGIFITAIWAFIVRSLCGIDTNLKKTLFTFGVLLYLLPYQIALVILNTRTLEVLASDSSVLANLDWLQKITVLTSDVAVPILALLMSLWIYRILVSRKNSKLKVLLAILSNILFNTAAILAFESTKAFEIYITWAILAVWLATAADITFEGFGYKIVEKSLEFIKSKLKKPEKV